jgi:hypothetical protein
MCGAGALARQSVSQGQTTLSFRTRFFLGEESAWLAEGLQTCCKTWGQPPSAVHRATRDFRKGHGPGRAAKFFDKLSDRLTDSERGGQECPPRTGYCSG